MPIYNKQGKIPAKRHTAFTKEDGSIYYEELVSREGFSSIYSNLYHLQRPTKISKVGELIKHELVKAETKHRARHIITAKLDNAGDAISARTPLFFNSDIIILSTYNKLFKNTLNNKNKHLFNYRKRYKHY